VIGRCDLSLVQIAENIKTLVDEIGDTAGGGKGDRITSGRHGRPTSLFNSLMHLMFVSTSVSIKSVHVKTTQSPGVYINDV
jgi:ribosomal protein L1